MIFKVISDLLEAFHDQYIKECFMYHN